MKNAIYLLVLSISITVACNNAQSNSGDSESENSSSDLKTLWKDAINSQSNLDTLYKDNAVKLFSDGTNLSGGKAIAAEYLNRPNEIKSINNIYTVVAREDKGISYDIGTFKDKDDFTYVYMWVWNNSSGAPQIELDYFDGQSDAQIDSMGLNQSRNAFMEYVSTHDVEGLIKNVYTPNTMYFNHKKLVVGTDDMIEKYSYMARPDYELNLSPLHIEPVNDNIALEIGQCSGTYGGKYMLVWQRNYDGVWRILIDSNV